MKIVYATLTTALTIALALPLMAQPPQDTTKMKYHDMSSMKGKPTFDATVDGSRLRGWIVTQQEHLAMMTASDPSRMNHKDAEGKDTSMRMGEDMKDMDRGASTMGTDMKEMKHDHTGMDQATKDAMMAGTHHLMIDVSDVATGTNTANATGRVLIVSPSKKNSSVALLPAMSHLGSGLTLDEKGDYQFTLYVNVNGVSKTTQFSYDVKQTGTSQLEAH